MKSRHEEHVELSKIKEIIRITIKTTDLSGIWISFFRTKKKKANPTRQRTPVRRSWSPGFSVWKFDIDGIEFHREMSCYRKRLHLKTRWVSIAVVAWVPRVFPLLLAVGIIGRNVICTPNNPMPFQPDNLSLWSQRVPMFHSIFKPEECSRILNSTKMDSNLGHFLFPAQLNSHKLWLISHFSNPPLY